MRIKIFLSLFILLFSIGISHAKEPIPYKEFVVITEQALDALDEVESVFGRFDTTKIEARASLKKLTAALKKYDRYVKGRWPDGKQSEIVYQLSIAEFIYSVSLTVGKFDDEDKTKAEEAAQKTRELFMQYKRRAP